jgi:hypothetical protein
MRSYTTPFWRPSTVASLLDLLILCSPIESTSPTSLYGLKQAPQAWYSRFATYITSLGFVEAKSDNSLFIFRRGIDLIYLLIYVDDIILTASSAALLQQTISALKRKFGMKDLGPLHHLLGVSVLHQADEFFLTQRQFALDILE